MSGRVDLGAMRGWAVEIRRLDTATDETTADYLEAAAAELAEWRRATPEPRSYARSPVDVPVDLGHLRAQANAMLCGHPITLTDFIRIGRDILSAAAELDLWRRPRIPADTTRLDACRDRASRIVAALMVGSSDAPQSPERMAAAVENIAHALLAAEREPGK